MEEKYWELAIKYFTDEISDQEEIELKSWIAESDEHQKQFDEVKNLVQTSTASFETYTLDTAAEWKKLRASIDAESSNTKIVDLFKQHWWKGAAAAVLIFGLSYFLIPPAADTLVDNTVDGSPEIENVSAHDTLNNIPNNTANEPIELATFVEVTTEDSAIVFLLPDSSIIHLNKNSTLRYPAHFSDTLRNVSLQGEAFFEVVRNPNAPFIVDASNTQTRVLGTSFNVRAYEDDDDVEVVLKEGKVEFSANKKKVILRKGEKVKYGKKTKKYKKSKSGKHDLDWHLKGVGKDIKDFFKKVGKKLKKSK